MKSVYGFGQNKTEHPADITSNLEKVIIGRKRKLSTEKWKDLIIRKKNNRFFHGKVERP